MSEGITIFAVVRRIGRREREAVRLRRGRREALALICVGVSVLRERERRVLRCVEAAQRVQRELGVHQADLHLQLLQDVALLQIL